jgi:flavorubredoxin
MVVKKINEKIYMFRQVDWELKDFHGSIYPLDNGTTYNSYLIIDEKVTLIDTMEDEFMDIFKIKLKKILNGRDIDNLVVNHVEPDHSGGFIEIFETFNVKNVYTSASGKRSMQKQFFKDVEYTKVVTHDTLSIGEYTLQFMLTPFVHWPDNMVTYLKEEKILFSNDAFGQHVTSTQTYADDFGIGRVLESAKEYYANIVLPYSKRVVPVLEALKDIEIKAIFPAHGIAYKETVKDIIAAYNEWANGEVKEKAVIIYDSMWGNSKTISLTLGEALYEVGLDVKRFQISKMRSSTIMKEIMDAKYILVGTGNHNGTMIPAVADFIERISGSRLMNKKGMTFGSYGWSKDFAKKLESRVSEAGIELIADGIYVNYVPTEEDLEQIFNDVKRIFKED